jgi:hypothetical protein
MPPTTAPKPIRYIIEQARFHPAAALGLETHQSFPIPVGAGAALRVVFLYCPSRAVPREGLYLAAPNYRATLSATTGKFEELKAVEPPDLGVPADPADSLGTFGLPDGMTSEQYLELQNRLYDGYDALLPLFADDVRSLQTLPRLATQFESIFFELSERGLRPYYRAVGKRFFDWLGSVTTP